MVEVVFKKESERCKLFVSKKRAKIDGRQTEENEKNEDEEL